MANDFKQLNEAYNEMSYYYPGEDDRDDSQPEPEWAVWCVVDGLMGHREGWLKKGEPPEVERFWTEDEADTRARGIMGKVGMNSPTRFRYYAKKYNTWE